MACIFWFREGFLTAKYLGNKKDDCVSADAVIFFEENVVIVACQSDFLIYFCCFCFSRCKKASTSSFLPAKMAVSRACTRSSVLVRMAV